MAFKLTDAGLFVSGHDVAFWTFVTPKIRIDTRFTMTDSGIRSANGYNTRHAALQFSTNILLLLLLLLLSVLLLLLLLFLLQLLLSMSFSSSLCVVHLLSTGLLKTSYEKKLKIT